MTGNIPEEVFSQCLQLPWQSDPPNNTCSLTSSLFYLFLHQNWLEGSIPSSIGGARGE